MNRVFTGSGLAKSTAAKDAGFLSFDWAPSVDIVEKSEKAKAKTIRVKVS